MIRIATPIVCAVFLSACSSLPDWVAASAFLDSGASDMGHYSFDWHLSGERQVAPIQVFDNGKKTWLQFMPGQVVPAIFERTKNGERPLSYVRQGDYLIIKGVWPTLSFRGGLLHASAHKSSKNDSIGPGDAGSSTFSVLTTPAADVQVMSEHRDLPPMGEQPVVMDTPALSNDGVRRLTHASFESIGSVSPAEASDATMLQDQNPEALYGRALRDEKPETSYGMALRDHKPDALYGITLQDQNLRRALHRWAVQAKWTFAPEHWAVDVDIPVSGEASFDGSFQDAVQGLLSATELAERPLRPCFYSNRVLRVVSYTQSCDRSAGARES